MCTSAYEYVRMIEHFYLKNQISCQTTCTKKHELHDVIYRNLGPHILHILYAFVIRERSILSYNICLHYSVLTFPREASISLRSSLSINPSLFWSIMLKASLNSWIWSWSNIANTLEVARWARFFVPALLWVFLLAILAAGFGA